VVGVADKIIARAESDGNIGELMKAQLVRCVRVTEVTPDSLATEIAAINSLRSRLTNAADRAVATSVLSGLYADNAEMRNMACDEALTAIRAKAELVGVSALKYSPLVEAGKDAAYYNHSLYYLLASRTVQTLRRYGGDYYAAVDSIYRDIDAMCAADASMADGRVLTALDRVKLQRERLRRESGDDDWRSYSARLDSLMTLYAGRATCAEVQRAKDELWRPILAPVLTVRTESVVYPGEESRFAVSFKNINSLTISVSKAGKEVMNRLFKLTPSADYSVKDTTLTLTLGEPGEYSVTASAEGAKTVTRSLYVSRLRLLALRLPGKDMELVAVDDKSGRPQSGVTLKILDSNDKTQRTLTTDNEGRAICDWQKNYRSVKAERSGDSALPPMIIYGNYGMSYGGRGSFMTDEVRLLTDRSIYRPGQVVLVKGVAYRRGTDSAGVIAGRSYRLTLTDGSRKEVASAEVATNDFGSFTAELLIPENCRNGMFTLRVDGVSTTIRVEEYKRPTFDVTIDALTGSYRTGDSVSFTGVATMLNGVALGDATYEYSLKRTQWHWWRGGGAGETIASGKGTTGDNGRFTIETLLATQRPNDKNNYRYTLEVDVTSAAGETQQSSCRICAGQSALILSVEADELICRNDSAQVRLHAVNMNGQSADVRGEYRLYRIAAGDTMQVVAAKNVDMNRSIMVNRTWSRIGSGRYLLRISTSDEHGREAKAECSFTLFSPDDTRPPVATKEWWREENLSFDAAHPARFSYGTSERDVYVMVRMFSKDSLLESRLITLSDTIVNYEIPYRTEYGDGVSMLFTFVKNGEVYCRTARMTRRLPERELTMAWSTFRDKLRPGDEERWRLTLKRADGETADAEVAAMMYDAALDRLWQRGQSLQVRFALYAPGYSWQIRNYGTLGFYLNFVNQWKTLPALAFDSFYWPVRGAGLVTNLRGERMVLMSAKASAAKSEGVVMSYTDAGAAVTEDSSAEEEENDDRAEVRTDFAETAFFSPSLRTDSTGAVSVEFTIPESLTEWRFNAYAHTRDMNYGALTALVRTQKELMVVPNLPRFVRIGDRTSVAASIINMSDKPLEGTARLTLFNPETEKNIERRSNRFSVEAGGTAVVKFEFNVPDGVESLGCRIVADGGRFSDGEQRLLPVLSDRIHLVESVAMKVAGGEERSYPLSQLFNGQSRSAANRKLTVELIGNTAWAAVQALPSIAKPESDNAFSWAAALYANAISLHIVKEHPEIGEEVTLNNDLTMAQRRLRELQLADGSWPWFRGMKGSMTVTNYVAELNARLALLTETKLSGELSQMQSAAIDFLHSEMARRYAKLTAKERENYSLSGADLHYLYVVALSGEAVKTKYTKSYQFYLSRVKAMLQSEDMGNMALAAVVLQCTGSKREATQLVNSMREHLSTDADGALSFAFNERPGSFAGRQLPVHVAALEAFHTVAADSAVVEKMKLWLLQRKRCQKWNSTPATADAVYALLMRGASHLLSGSDVTAEVGGHRLSTKDDTAVGGRAYVTATYDDSRAVSAKSVELRNSGETMAWGAVFAECDEELDRVAQQSAGLIVERETVGDAHRVGDRLTVRTTLQVPSRMDFVELEVAHAACMEPEESLSGYRWNGSVGYYQEVKDSATKYYFDSIGKGVYTFETTYRVSREGDYQGGISSVRCSYAPEYSAHSASRRVEIR
jgi:hypothetical protein